jgi:peroxiredoxin/uncharacterized membrane protein YphA (DoxX/SURF4 family)
LSDSTDMIFLLLRWLLALVLGFAGFVKLRDQANFRISLKEFGVPPLAVIPLAAALPLFEILTAVALIPSGSASWGAASALILFGTFAIAIAINLARGHTPECQCFGKASSKPIGSSTLIRTLILGTIAVLLLVKGPGLGVSDVVGSQITFVSSTLLILNISVVILVGGLAILVFSLWRQQGRFLMRLDALENHAGNRSMGNGVRIAGLAIGMVAPSFALQDLRGGTLTLDNLLAHKKPILLVFTDPNCPTCVELLPEIAQWQQGLAARLTIGLISVGDLKQNEGKLARYQLTTILLQKEKEIADLYKVVATPSAVLIRSDHTIGTRLAEGPDAIRDLVAMIAGASVSLKKDVSSMNDSQLAYNLDRENVA